MASIEQSAQVGFVKADKYDEWRPSYPDEAVDGLLSNLGLKGSKGTRIVELGAGTGKFTEILAVRDEQYEIIAVEPHDDMREVLEAKRLSRVTVVKGSGVDMPLVENDWADAVIVAQAFHWFANMEALQEIHRVLKDLGTLGLIWNREAYGTPLEIENSTKWERKLKELVWGRGNTEPRRRHAHWRKVFDEQTNATPVGSLTGTSPLFTLPLGEADYNWISWLKPDQIWNRFSTISHISVLDPKELEEIQHLVYDAINEDAERNDQGQVAVHGHTNTSWTTAIPT